jgi:alpha-glucosidase
MVWESGTPKAGFTTGRPWLPVAAAHLSRAVDKQHADDTSVLAHYRRLLSFRRKHPALVKGDITFLENASPEPTETLAFVRRFKGTAILCVFNLSAEPAAFQTDGSIRLRAIDLPGLGGRIDGDRIVLEGHETFFGHVA